MSIDPAALARPLFTSAQRHVAGCVFIALALTTTLSGGNSK